MYGYKTKYIRAIFIVKIGQIKIESLKKKFLKQYNYRMTALLIIYTSLQKIQIKNVCFNQFFCSFES